MGTALGKHFRELAFDEDPFTQDFWEHSRLERLERVQNIPIEPEIPEPAHQKLQSINDQAPPITSVTSDAEVQRGEELSNEPLVCNAMDHAQRPPAEPELPQVNEVSSVNSPRNNESQANALQDTTTKSFIYFPDSSRSIICDSITVQESEGNALTGWCKLEVDTGDFDEVSIQLSHSKFLKISKSLLAKESEDLKQRLRDCDVLFAPDNVDDSAVFDVVKALKERCLPKYARWSNAFEFLEVCSFIGLAKLKAEFVRTLKRSVQESKNYMDFLKAASDFVAFSQQRACLFDLLALQHEVFLLFIDNCTSSREAKGEQRNKIWEDIQRISKEVMIVWQLAPEA